MDEKRYKELELNPDALFTSHELAEGVHRCPEWDFMVICHGMPEVESCNCKISQIQFAQLDYVDELNKDIQAKQVQIDALMRLLLNARDKFIEYQMDVDDFPPLDHVKFMREINDATSK